MLLAGSHVNVTLPFLLYNFSYSINQRQPLLWKKDFPLSYSPYLSHSLTLSWQQTADDSTILTAILIVLALDSSTHLQLDLSVFSCSLDPMPKCISSPLPATADNGLFAFSATPDILASSYIVPTVSSAS